MDEAEPRRWSSCGPPRRVGARVFAVAALSGLLAGCRVIGTVGVVAVGVVGVAGYAVYKTGEVAVTGVGKAASAAGSAVSSGSKSVTTVVYSDNEFRAEYAAGVMPVWAAARAACDKARFLDIDGASDGLSGRLTAKTWDRQDITVTLTRAGSDATEARIRVGVKGDMRTSETLHQLIQQELSQEGAS